MNDKLIISKAYLNSYRFRKVKNNKYQVINTGNKLYSPFTAILPGHIMFLGCSLLDCTGGPWYLSTRIYGAKFLKINTSMSTSYSATPPNTVAIIYQ